MESAVRPAQPSGSDAHIISADGNFRATFLTDAGTILGLDQFGARPLPPRVEHLWRRDGFAAEIPFTNAALVPMGTADAGMLYEAIAAVVARHEILRTRLAVKDGRAIQIAESWKVSRLEVSRVRREELTDSRPGHLSAAGAFAQGTPDLYAQDGFRCHGFRDETGEITLGLLAHGFFADAWSAQLLLREIRAAYAALETRSALCLPPVLQYADYARSVLTALGAGLQSHLGHWHRVLKGAAPADLPCDRDGDTSRRGRSFFFLKRDLADRLSAIARQHRVSLMILLLAACQIAQARWSGMGDILSAVYTADRVKPEFHNTVGMLITNMPVRSLIDPGASLDVFLGELSRAYYGGYAHRELSCELYEAVFAPPSPFCATVFNFVPLQKGAADDDPFAVRAFEGIVATPDAARPAIYREIYLGLSQHPDGILGKLFYNAGRFSPEAMAAFVENFRTVAERMATDPAPAIKALLGR
jgi:hypothetical protein